LTGFCPKGAECEYSHPKWDTSSVSKLTIKSDEEYKRELQEKKRELQKLRERQESSMKRELDEDTQTSQPAEKKLKKQKV
jgi:cleavage and polyadenylation specificity factor subunit 4